MYRWTAEFAIDVRYVLYGSIDVSLVSIYSKCHHNFWAYYISEYKFFSFKKGVIICIQIYIYNIYKSTVKVLDFRGSESSSFIIWVLWGL